MAKSSHSSKSAADNRANQLNPQHPAYHQSRGASSSEVQQRVADSSVNRDANNDVSQRTLLSPDRESSVKPE